MKKVILALVIVLCISSCKEETKPEPARQNACILIEDIPDYLKSDSMAGYLQANYKDFCDREIWWKIVHRSHNITKDMFEDSIAVATASTQGVSEYTTKTWEQISDLFVGIPESNIYSKFISFKTDATSNKKLDFELVNKYRIAPSCFSIALFKSIEQKFGHDEVENMKFKFIELRDRCDIYFKVVDANGTTVGFYDISTDPKLVCTPLTHKIIL